MFQKKRLTSCINSVVVNDWVQDTCNVQHAVFCSLEPSGHFSELLLPVLGRVSRPIIYHVENMRDGSSFSTRLVKAVQNGDIIFTSMVTYHKHEPELATHQYPMPDVPPPESLETYVDLLQKALRYCAIFCSAVLFFKICDFL